MWIRRRTPSADSSAEVIRSTSSSVAASPISRPFISIARKMAITISSTPMLIEPTASHRGSSVKWASSTPPSARNRPISAPMSSSRTTGSSGCLDRRSHVHHEVSELPLLWAHSLIALRNEQGLEGDGDEQDGDGDGQVADLVRVADLLDALVERRTARPSRRAPGRRRTTRSSARGRSRTGARGRPASSPACRRAAAAPGCRCRPASGSPRRAARPTAVIAKPANLAMAIPRLAKNAYSTALRLPSVTAATTGSSTTRGSPSVLAATG